MKLYRFSVPAIIAILAFPFTIQAQVDTATLSRKMDLLNRKLYLDLPANAKLMPRVADIMAADPNQNQETRIFIEDGNRKLVIMATETLIMATDNFLAELNKAEPTTEDYSRKQLNSGDSVITILNTPTIYYDSTESAILINSLLVKNPDKTVSRVDAYINPEAFQSKDEYVRLSEKIFNTLSKGTRRLNLAARTESFKVFGTTSKIKMNLPKNYFVLADEKYDFGVLRVNAYRMLGDTTFSSMTIYTGHHPTYFYNEYGLNEADAKKTPGKYLAQAVDWLEFRDPTRDLFLREQFVHADFIETGLILHVAITTNTEKALKEMISIADQMSHEK